MFGIMALLMMSAVLLLLVGLVSPKVVVRWGGEPTRGRVVRVYALAFVAFAVLAAIWAPPSEERLARQAERKQKEDEPERKTSQQAETEIQRILSLSKSAAQLLNEEEYSASIDSAEAAIELLKRNEFPGADTLGIYMVLNRAETELVLKQAEKKLTQPTGSVERAVERLAHHVFGSTVVWDDKELPSIVAFEFRRKKGQIKIDYRWNGTGGVNEVLADIISFAKFLYSDPIYDHPHISDINDFLLVAHHILVDKYGQEEEGEVGRFGLSRDVALKLNWKRMYEDRAMFQKVLEEDGQFCVHPSFAKTERRVRQMQEALREWGKR